MTRNCVTGVALCCLGLLLAGCGGGAEDRTQAEVPTETAGMASDSGMSVAGSEVELCLAHGADASKCFICDSELRDPDRLWCREHGRYEDRCFECHPELEDENRLFCDEHGLYEDECFICHPELQETSSTPLGDACCPPSGQSGAAGSHALEVPSSSPQPFPSTANGAHRIQTTSIVRLMI